MEYFKHQLTFDIDPLYCSLALSPNGDLLVSGGLDRNTIHVWDTNTGWLVNSWLATPLQPHCNINIKYPIESILISYDGFTLITGGLSLKKWELETGKRLRVLKGAISRVENLFVSDDDNILFSSISGKMFLWNLRTNEEICSIVQDYWTISPDGMKIITRENEKSLNVWEMKTKKLVNVLKSKSGIRIQNLTFSRNGKLLAGGGYEGIIIWDFETGECAQVIDKFKNVRFHEHRDQILSSVFSIDNNHLWTTGRDGVIQYWDINNGKNSGTLQSENPIAKIYMSNDCQTFIGGDGRQKIEVWSKK